MITKEWILAALRPVADPRFEQSLVEMQWIRDIMVKENRISLTVVTADLSEDMKDRLDNEIKARLTQAGAVDLHVRYREASDSEREKVGLPPQNGEEANEVGPGGGSLKGHGVGLEKLPLMDPASGVTFIAVASGKGGVGKSTITANLAVALARQGKRVGLIDADIYGFSIPDMMGIEEAPQVEDGVIMPVERFGVKVMSMGFFVRENNPVIWRGPMLGRMLRQFLADVNWGELDFLLLDLPPGTGDVALDVHQMLPQTKEIIVTTPHATAAFVAARAGAMALQTDHELLGVVENMAYYECSSCGERDYIFGRGGGARLAETLHTELLAQVPLGAPDNHLSEPDFSPSVYKADTKTAAIFAETALHIIEKCKKD
ncbi:Mrp/NBP35 family ATP-binding protein [Paenibacillus physcomitrellae]|uniref:Iron-sulfur cluster carrier protein n=1 Tax=Paenibacillus physcomitrellae TaxID=1619311 RepID=A0ABQ1GXG1_9BACL|nr:Mrp/NBP35 family ATP-binding protein [Paenibacillus physcomitrellae]GGA51849.1 iron-sulfur cluster carrier protein [Paenibacillus physcomitrellae]